MNTRFHDRPDRRGLGLGLARFCRRRHQLGDRAAYAHNGYFKSLWALVHFYNTRDTLNNGVHKPGGEPGEGITYWPFPEVNVNVDQTIGHLRLTDAEENQIVLFLQTLSDGYFVPPVRFNDIQPVQTTDHPRSQSNVTSSQR